MQKIRASRLQLVSDSQSTREVAAYSIFLRLCRLSLFATGILVVSIADCHADQCSLKQLGKVLAVTGRHGQISEKLQPATDATEGATWQIFRARGNANYVERTDFGEAGKRTLGFDFHAARYMLLTVRVEVYGSPLGSGLQEKPRVGLRYTLFCPDGFWTLTRDDIDSSEEIQLHMVSAKEALDLLLEEHIPRLGVDPHLLAKWRGASLR